LPNQGQLTKILVFAERIVADLMERYPALTKVAAPAAGSAIATFVIKGSAATLQEAHEWLTKNGHKHEAH
jgi:hypothetical protein